MENKQNWTPGPLEQARTDQYDQSIDIFQAPNGRTLFRTINSLPIEEAEANAKRLVALWNAPDMAAELATLRKDKAELVERLHECFKYIEACEDHGRWNDIDWRALISKHSTQGSK